MIVDWLNECHKFRRDDDDDDDKEGEDEGCERGLRVEEREEQRPVSADSEGRSAEAVGEEAEKRVSKRNEQQAKSQGSTAWCWLLAPELGES